MLEAGKKLDINKELKSLEWPYDHPRRGDMPPGHHALTLNEYTIRQPPYAAGSSYPKVYSYVQGWGGSDYSKNIVVDEKEHPYTGTNYAWVRARCLGGKTNIWGRLALRLSDYDFKAKSRDGYGDDWPIWLQGHRAVLRPGRSVSRHLGRQGEPAVPARQPVSAPDETGPGRSHAAQLAQEDEPGADAVSRGRHDRRAEAQQVSQPLFRTRRVQPSRGRLRHPRRLRLADRPHLPGDGHRQPDAPDELDRPRDPRRSQDRQSARRGRSRHRDGTRIRSPRQGRHRGRLDARIGAAPAAVEIRHASRTASATRAATSATTSASTSWVPASPAWSRTVSAQPQTIDDGRPGGFYVPRFRNLADKQRQLHSRLRLRGQRRQPRCSPRTRRRHAGLRRRLQEDRPRLRRRVHRHGRVRRSAAPLRESCRARSGAEGQVGHSRPPLQLQVRRQREEDVRGHGQHGAGDVRAGRLRDRRTSIERC